MLCYGQLLNARRRATTALSFVQMFDRSDRSPAIEESVTLPNRPDERMVRPMYALKLYRVVPHRRPM